MISQFLIRDSLPPPARTAIQVVQAALKVNRQLAAQILHQGGVQLQGRVITQPHYRFQVGDLVDIEFVAQPTKATSKSKKKSSSQQSGKFEVVHEDERLIVVNKPAGLLTVPSPKREKNNLRAQLQKWTSKADPKAKIICVHRLDRGVSGLLVFAKDDTTASELISQFAARKPRRRYAAIVAGHLPKKRGTITSYLATDEKTLNRYSVPTSEEGELATTHFEVREYWNEASLIQLQLETGRRNQIRVHLAEAGHPIIGDPRYAPELASHVHWPHRRIALHAELLGFQHPLSGEQLEFQASWPQEFRDLRRKLNRSSEKRGR